MTSGCDWNADRAVPIEVLMESGLKRFQRGAGSGHNVGQVGEIVATAVCAPHRVSIRARHLPSKIKTARRLLRPDRRPRRKLTDDNGRTEILQLRPDPGTAAAEEI